MFICFGDFLLILGVVILIVYINQSKNHQSIKPNEEKNHANIQATKKKKKKTNFSFLEFRWRRIGEPQGLPEINSNSNWTSECSIQAASQLPQKLKSLSQALIRHKQRVKCKHHPELAPMADSVCLKTQSLNCNYRKFHSRKTTEIEIT